MNAIEIKNLTKSYKDFTLDNLTLALPTGCIMGLVGENGAGKSTTIKLVLEMIKKDSGEITVLGCDNSEMDKEDIGIVLDEVGIPDCLNAFQVGKIMKHIYKKWDSEVYNSYIKRFNLPWKKKFKDFSKGMKMKLGLAIALSHDPQLLILDEATAGLDPVVRDDLLDIFAEFTRDETHSILISSHIVSDLEKICDYIAFINKGKLMLCEDKDVLYEQYGMVHMSSEDFELIPDEAVKGKKITPYGVEAIVRRNSVADNVNISPISIEELFVFMVKEAR